LRKVDYPPQLQAESLPEGCLPDLLWPPEIGVDLPDEVNLTEWLLDRNLEGAQADRVAYYAGERAVTYRTLSEWVNRFANALRDLGIEQGDRVMLRIANSVEYVVCALAVSRLAAVVVPTMTLLRERVITHDANTSEAKAIICGYELLGEVEAGRDRYTSVRHIISVGGDPEDLERRGLLSYDELLASGSDRMESVRVHPDSLAAVFFTSGTTGLPKGCMHLIRTIIGSVHSYPLTFGGLRPTDVFLGSPPLAFVIGYGYNMLLPLLGGVPSVILEGRMSVESLLEAIPRYKVTMFNAVPTAFNQLLNMPTVRDYDLSTLRVVMSGSAPLLASTFQGFKDLTGLEIVNGIGSSESIGTQLASYLPGYKPGATGWPVPGVHAKIIDEEGRECPPGVTGRLLIKACYGTMYWRNPDRQREAVIDGWSLSGDFAYKDEDGLFWHVSRIDDIIKSRGYRVSPGEVEDALNEHPAIYESTVIGIPDPEQGQRVKAFAVLKAGFSGSPELVEEIRASVKKRVAPYMAPSEIEFVGSLPKTETGKVRRVELRELEAKRAAEREVLAAGAGPRANAAEPGPA
jgi:2-aminobenzoate-CoA ligase